MKSNYDKVIKRPSAHAVKTFILTIIFIIASIGLGFIIAYYGKGESFIETDFLNIIITLFGFGLTSTVFIYQTVKNKESDQALHVIQSLTKTLVLIFALIIISILFDFIANSDVSEKAIFVMNVFKNASLIYALICLADVFLSFITIIKAM